MANQPWFRAGTVRGLLLVPGVACLLIGGGFAVEEALYHGRAHRVTGKIVDEFGFKDMLHPGGRHNFLYNIDFTTRDGAKITFQDESVGRQLPFKEPVEVLYDPREPRNARLASRERLFFPKRLVPPGLLFCLLGGVLLRRRSPAEHAAVS